MHNLHCPLLFEKGQGVNEQKYKMERSNGSTPNIRINIILTLNQIKLRSNQNVLLQSVDHSKMGAFPIHPVIK